MIGCTEATAWPLTWQHFLQSAVVSCALCRFNQCFCSFRFQSLNERASVDLHLFGPRFRFVCVCASVCVWIVLKQSFVCGRKKINKEVCAKRKQKQQRATFSLSGAAANKQKFKTLAAVESYSCSCALLSRRFSSVVGVLVAAVHFVVVLFCWLTAERAGEEGGDKRARPSEVPSARGRFLFLFTYYVRLCVYVKS